MLEKLASAWAIPDIQKRLKYVLLVFLIYVVASHIPMAGINHEAVDKLVQSGLLNAYDIFSGGALKRVSVIGLSLMPYINASIIMQLMTVAIPQLQALSKEGETGRRTINKYTRYASIVLGFVQAIGLYNMFASGGAIQKGWFTALTMAVVIWRSGALLSSTQNDRPWVAMTTSRATTTRSETCTSGRFCDSERQRVPLSNDR